MCWTAPLFIRLFRNVEYPNYVYSGKFKFFEISQLMKLCIVQGIFKGSQRQGCSILGLQTGRGHAKPPHSNPMSNGLSLRLAFLCDSDAQHVSLENDLVDTYFQLVEARALLYAMLRYTTTPKSQK
jgi:hypothetical protein